MYVTQTKTGEQVVMAPDGQIFVLPKRVVLCIHDDDRYHIRLREKMCPHEATRLGMAA